jgi:TrmH family RNA methyltransferase
MVITSVNNDLIKETSKLLQKKYREESGLFLIEGTKCVEEALSSGLEVIHIFSQSGFESYPQRIEVTEHVLAKISDAKTPPKVVAVVKQIKHSLDELNGMKKVVLLEGIKDAGNLGTILRTSAAFALDGVVLYGDTVDLYNPKCVRAAVGNLWKQKVFSIKDFQVLKDVFSSYERIATLPAGENVIPLKDFVTPDKTLVMFGSEADGLSKELKEFATKNLTIEMASNVESLNLSISAGIILYKLFQFKK